MNKTLYFLFFAFFISIFLGTSCQKPCPEKKGFTVTGKGKDCVYTEIPGYVDENIYVGSSGKPGESLAQQLPAMKELLESGKVVGVNFTTNLNTDTTDYKTNRDFGTLQKDFPKQVVIKYNNYGVAPAHRGQILTRSESKAWNDMKLVKNIGSAKNGGIPWQIPLQDLHQFLADGVDISAAQIVLEMFNVDDLINNYALLEQTINQGYAVTPIAKAYLHTPNEKKYAWENLGGLQKQFPGKVDTEWGIYNLCPHNTQGTITYAEMVKMNFPKYGMSVPQGHKWTIRANELPLIEPHYPDASQIFTIGPAVQTIVIDITNTATLHEAQGLIQMYTGIYQNIQPRIAGSFAIDSNDAAMLAKLFGMEKQGKCTFVNGTGKISFANEAVYFEYSTPLYRLNQLNSLEATTIASGKYAFIGPNAGMDSVPATQFYRKAEMSSNNPDLFTKGIPDRVNGPLNFKNVPQSFWTNWKLPVETKLAAGEHHSGVGDREMDHFRLNGADEKPGAIPVIWSNKVIWLTNYDPIGSPSPEPNGMDISSLNIGPNTNNSLIKSEKVIIIAGAPVKASNKNIGMNIETNDQAYISNGRTILNSTWVTQQMGIYQLSGIPEHGKLEISNAAIHLTSDFLKINYQVHVANGGTDAEFLTYLGIIGNNNIVLLSLPGGKKAWNSQSYSLGGKGKSHTTYQPKPL